MVNGIVLIGIVNVFDTKLLLPAESVNVLAATLIVPDVVLFDVAVNNTVYDIPDPVKLLIAPAEYVISSIIKFVDASLNVNVIISLLFILS